MAAMSPKLSQPSDRDSGLPTLPSPTEALAKPVVNAMPGSRPLSYQQQSMWFWNELEPHSPLYNIPLALRLRGRLDCSALEASLNLVLTRHATLRTNFFSNRGVPFQVISEGRALTVSLMDISGLPVGDREHQLSELVNQEARRPFDLANDLMLRACLIRLGDADHALVLTTHHIASDGCSLGILLRELFEAYTAHLSGCDPALPNLSLQYADFALRQRQRNGPEAQSQLNFWKQKLAGNQDYHHLTPDYPRPSKQSFRGAVETVSIPDDLISSLTALAHRCGASLFMTFLAALQVLLHRYSGHEDIFVAFPIANRSRSDIANLIGFFANTLVFCGNASGNPTFLNFLERVRDGALDAYSNQEVPFEKIIEELQPDRRLGHPPLYQVMLVLQDSLEPALKISGLTVERLDVTTATAKCDLSISLERKDQFELAFEYNRDLFDVATVQRMIDHYVTLLQGIVKSPATPIGELPILTNSERHKLLVEFNQTQQPYPQVCVHELVEAQARRTPDAIAIASKEQVLTYRELDHRASALASKLRAVGVGPESLVGVLLPRSANAVLSFLAIFKAGGAYLPLDPKDPSSRLSLLAEGAGARVLVTLEKYKKLLPDGKFEVLALDGPHAQAEGADNPAETGVAAEHSVRPSPDQLAYVLYTSGSTGTPKGVEITHRAIVRLLLGQDYLKVSDKDVFLQVNTLSFDPSIIEIWGALLHGAQLVIFPETTPTPDELADVIRDNHVTIVSWLTTSLFNVVIDKKPDALATVRQVSVGGEALSVPHIRRALALLPGVQFINAYGPTENSTLSTFYRIPRQVEEAASSIPIGKPIATAKAFVLDRYMQPVPVGVAGELYVGGEGIARGYRNQPALTAERFIPNPFADKPGEKIYKTGDRVRYLPDGNLEYLGRFDHQVKIRGFRVELGEIEANLREFPGVKATAVAVREEFDKTNALIAYLVPDENKPVNTEDLRNFLRLRLPDYMVPLHFLFLDEMPLLKTGKVDRRALAALPLPQPERVPVVKPARHSVEAELVTLWQGLFGRQPIGVTDNFYDLGGHSLLAMRLIAEIESNFGKKIDLSLLINAPTIESLAEHLRNADRIDCNSVVSMQPHGSRPPLYCVHGGGGHVLRFRDLAKALGSEQPFYGLRAPLFPDYSSPVTVESLASKYLADIRKVQASGPYHLAGASFGGLVAYEMACQLRSQGEEVGIVALFDTGNPDFCSSLPALRALQFKVVRRLQTIRYRLAEFREVAAGEPIKVGNELFQAARLKIGNWLWSAGYTASRWSHQPLPERLWDNLKLFLHAGAMYKPRPYPGRILLFKAEEQKAQFGPDRELGWGKLALGGVHVIDVPGDHMSLLEKPRVEVLATHLRECMDAVQTSVSQTPQRVSLSEQSATNSSQLDNILPLEQTS